LASFDGFAGAAASTRERGNLSDRSIYAQSSVCIYLEKLSIFKRAPRTQKGYLADVQQGAAENMIVSQISLMSCRSAQGMQGPLLELGPPRRTVRFPVGSHFKALQFLWRFCVFFPGTVLR
jgi:hypothetical protein